MYTQLVQHVRPLSQGRNASRCMCSCGARSAVAMALAVTPPNSSPPNSLHMCSHHPVQINGCHRNYLWVACGEHNARVAREAGKSDDDVRVTKPVFVHRRQLTRLVHVCAQLEATHQRLHDPLSMRAREFG